LNEQDTRSLSEAEIEDIRRQAHEHLQARHWEQAGDAFLKIVERASDDEDALYGIAQSLDGLGRYDSLLPLADNILNLYPNSARALAFKARALQKLERISEATIANDQALLLDNQLPLAWINRSGLQLLQQRFPEALRSAQRTVEIAPEDARAWANRGIALLNFQRLTEALADFDKSLQCDPQFYFSLQMRGEALCSLGRMQEVIANARQALQVQPNDVMILTQAAQALRSLEMYDGLQLVAKELIKQTPDSVFAWEHYMRSCRGMGMYNDANQAFDRLLELDPSNIQFWTFKADTLYRLERYREAVHIAERAVQFDMDYAPARRVHEKALKMMYQKKEKRRKAPAPVQPQE
jgi:tetratricopeptide (TPR) repeat protein